jgi:hypothetical protein
MSACADETKQKQNKNKLIKSCTFSTTKIFTSMVENARQVEG